MLPIVSQEYPDHIHNLNNPAKLTHNDDRSRFIVAFCSAETAHPNATIAEQKATLKRTSKTCIPVGHLFGFSIGVNVTLRNSTSAPSACNATCPLLAEHWVP